jgi:hypothetical protein
LFGVLAEDLHEFTSRMGEVPIWKLDLCKANTHQLTTNKPTNKQPNKKKKKLFAERRTKHKAVSVCQLNQSWNENSCLININRECVYAKIFGVLSEGADVFVIRTVHCLPEKPPLTIIILGKNLWMEFWKLNPNGD